VIAAQAGLGLSLPVLKGLGGSRLRPAVTASFADNGLTCGACELRQRPQRERRRLRRRLHRTWLPIDLIPQAFKLIPDRVSTAPGAWRRVPNRRLLRPQPTQVAPRPKTARFAASNGRRSRGSEGVVGMPHHVFHRCIGLFGQCLRERQLVSGRPALGQALHAAEIGRFNLLAV